MEFSGSTGVSPPDPKEQQTFRIAMKWAASHGITHPTIFATAAVRWLRERRERER